MKNYEITKLDNQNYDFLLTKYDYEFMDVIDIISKIQSNKETIKVLIDNLMNVGFGYNRFVFFGNECENKKSNKF